MSLEKPEITFDRLRSSQSPSLGERHNEEGIMGCFCGVEALISASVGEILHQAGGEGDGETEGVGNSHFIDFPQFRENGHTAGDPCYACVMEPAVPAADA